MAQGRIARLGLTTESEKVNRLGRLGLTGTEDVSTPTRMARLGIGTKEKPPDNKIFTAAKEAFSFSPKEMGDLFVGISGAINSIDPLNPAGKVIRSLKPEAVDRGTSLLGIIGAPFVASAVLPLLVTGEGAVSPTLEKLARGEEIKVGEVLPDAAVGVIDTIGQLLGTKEEAPNIATAALALLNEKDWLPEKDRNVYANLIRAGVYVAMGMRKSIKGTLKKAGKVSGKVIKGATKSTSEFASEGIRYIAKNIKTGKNVRAQKADFIKEFSPKIGKPEATRIANELAKIINEKGSSAITPDYLSKQLFPGVERPAGIVAEAPVAEVPKPTVTKPAVKPVATKSVVTKPVAKPTIPVVLPVIGIKKEEIIYERKSTDERRLIRKVDGKWVTQWHTPGEEGGNWVSVEQEDIKQLEEDIAKGIWKQQVKPKKAKFTKKGISAEERSRLAREAERKEAEILEPIDDKASLYENEDGFYYVERTDGTKVVNPAPVKDEDLGDIEDTLFIDEEEALEAYRTEEVKASEVALDKQTIGGLVKTESSAQLLAKETKIKDFAKKNKEDIIRKYAAKNGIIVSNDKMKELFRPVGYTGMDSEIYQGEAGKITKEYLDWLIDKDKGTGKDFILMTGGTGTGKSSFAKAINQEDTTAIFDVNLRNVNLSSKLIDQALEAGLKPKLVFVLRNPAKAFIDGILDRALNPDSPDYMRVVEIDRHIRNHKETKRAFEELVNKYGKKIEYEINDNRGGPGEGKPISLDEFKKIKYTYNEIEKELENYVKQNEQIPENLKQAFLRRTDKAGQPGDSKQPIHRQIQKGRGQDLQKARPEVKSRQQQLDEYRKSILPKYNIHRGALGKTEDLSTPSKLRGIDTFEGVESTSPQVELRLFEETKKIAKKYANIIGEKYVPKRFLGIQWGDTNNIFVRALNDLSTTIHEVVHHVDSKNGIFKRIMEIKGHGKTGNPIYASGTKAVRGALTKAYLEYYPGAKATHKLEKRVREGLAVFIENYVTQPTATREKYPSLYKEFLQGGKYYDSMLPALVKDAQNLIGAYQKLDPLKKVGSKVLSDDQPIIRDSFMNFWEKFITEVVDNVYPLEKIAKESGAQWTPRDPSLWTRLYNNMSGIVTRNISTNKGFIHFKNETLVKMFDYNWKTLTEGLKNDKLIDDFAYWLVARREHFAYNKLDELRSEAKKAADHMVFLREKGLLDTVQAKQEIATAKKAVEDYKRMASILRKDGFSREIIDEAYNKYKEQFVDQAEQFDNLVRADLDFLRDVGLVSQRNYEDFIKNEGYATFKRDIYNEVVGEGGDVSGITRTSKRVSSIKGRTGSELTIINPLYSSMQNHSEIMKKGLKQLINNKIYALRKNFPDIMQRIPLTKVPRLGGGFEYPQDRDPNILMAMSNGKRLPLLVSKELMGTINELLTFKNIHLFERLVVKTARLFTKGTTGLYPPFAIQNFFVDQVTASAQTTTKYTPIISQLNILFKQLQGHSKNGDYLKEYLMLGGQRHTLVGWLDMNPNEFFSAITKERNALQKVGDMLEQGTQILSTPTQASEILTRAVEYINSRNAGEHQVVALEKAGRVSAPFHHLGRLGGGTAGKTVIKSIPYFNASLQVLAQFSRTLKNPKTRDRAIFVLLALTAAMVGGFASILLKATEEQRDTYKDIHPRELAKYIFFPAPNGRDLLRFRIPEQMGVVGTLLNMALSDMMLGADYSTPEYIDAATAWVPDQFNVTDPSRLFFSWMPHIIGTTTEVLMNRRTYPKVMPIEGMSMERHEARFRYDKGTGWMAKYIGEHLNLSPKKIDYLIEGYLGRTTKFIKGGRISNPIVRQAYFMSGRRLLEFYELRQLNNQEYDSIKHRLREFSPEEKRKVVRLKNKLSIISKKLLRYRKLSEEDEDVRIRNLRENILNRIDALKYTK